MSTYQYIGTRPSNCVRANWHYRKEITTPRVMKVKGYRKGLEVLAVSWGGIIAGIAPLWVKVLTSLPTTPWADQWPALTLGKLTLHRGSPVAHWSQLKTLKSHHGGCRHRRPRWAPLWTPPRGQWKAGPAAVPGTQDTAQVRSEGREAEGRRRVRTLPASSPGCDQRPRSEGPSLCQSNQRQGLGLRAFSLGSLTSVACSRSRDAAEWRRRSSRRRAVGFGDWAWWCTPRD